MAARVLVVGVGATGGAIANSLARAGVGLTLVDRWAASRTISGPVQVQIVDATGQVMVERGKP